MAKKCLMDENKSPEDALSEIEMMSTTITAEDLARNKENMSAIKYMEDIQNVSSDEEEEDDDDDDGSSDDSESDDDLPAPSPPPPPPTPQPARKLQPKKKTTSSQLPPPPPTASFKKDDDALDIHCEDDLDEDFQHPKQQHKKQTPSSVVVVKPSSSKSKSSSSSSSSSSSDKKERVKRDSKGKPYLVSKIDDSYRIVHKGSDASFADETRKKLKKRLDKEKANNTLDFQVKDKKRFSPYYTLKSSKRR
ncbi:ubiquitin carboxyl-terminal hydrolase 36-like [Clytia hemisphaerica]|uniref:ubiquitin carboxyl-terminal hydrolase 36-like n=1 Tax=Clytia hemisphaerica TaxID=252671 RepID=UPI0034D57E1B